MTRYSGNHTAFRHFRSKYRDPTIPFVQQLEAADCGAAAICMVLRFYGKHLPLREVRDIVGSGRTGATAAGLVQAARTYGLRARGISIEADDVAQLPPATILYWEFRHFVVLEKVTSKGVTLLDPSSGRRVYSHTTFRRAFAGIALICEPSETFVRGDHADSRFSRIWRQVLSHRSLLARISIIAFVAQVFVAASPLLTGTLIDKVIPHADYSLFAVLAGAFLIFQMSAQIATFIRSHLLIYLRTWVEASMTLSFLDHLVQLPFPFFQRHTSGDLMVRLGINSTVKEVATSTALSAILDGVSSLVFLTVLIATKRSLALYVCALALAQILVLSYFKWRKKQILRKSLENQACSQTAQIELFAGMETLKAMGLEPSAAERWEALFVESLNLGVRGGRLDAAFSLCSGLLNSASSFIFLFYGALLVMRGDLTLGGMLAVAAMASAFLVPVGSLITALLQLQTIDVYLDKLNDVLETPVEQTSITSSFLAERPYPVSLTDVSFRYSRDDNFVLDGICITIPAGDKCALVGESGCGKSTIAKLAAGLYVPHMGSVSVAGRDIQSVNLRTYRRSLGFVSQESQLFSGSIRRNIALSDPDMALERVIRAAKIACIHDDIMNMPLAYDTPLSDRGMTLSGGQRQRIAIARAIAANPGLLVLDEATSHLDAVTEEHVNNNLQALHITSIIIAHRLTTITHCDQIIVIQRGRVAEQGTCHELLERGGPFSALYRAQILSPS